MTRADDDDTASLLEHELSLRPRNDVRCSILSFRELLLTFFDLSGKTDGSVAGVVGIEGGVVSGVINLESSGVGASDWRPRHEELYQEV